MAFRDLFGQHTGRPLTLADVRTDRVNEPADVPLSPLPPRRTPFGATPTGIPSLDEAQRVVQFVGGLGLGDDGAQQQQQQEQATSVLPPRPSRRRKLFSHPQPPTPPVPTRAVTRSRTRPFRPSRQELDPPRPTPRPRRGRSRRQLPSPPPTPPAPSPPTPQTRQLPTPPQTKPFTIPVTRTKVPIPRKPKPPPVPIRTPDLPDPTLRQLIAEKSQSEQTERTDRQRQFVPSDPQADLSLQQAGEVKLQQPRRPISDLGGRKVTADSSLATPDFTFGTNTGSGQIFELEQRARTTLGEINASFASTQTSRELQQRLDPNRTERRIRNVLEDRAFADQQVESARRAVANDTRDAITQPKKTIAGRKVTEVTIEGRLVEWCPTRTESGIVSRERLATRTTNHTCPTDSVTIGVSRRDRQ